jgi:regulator of RNase E activity RraA
LFGRAVTAHCEPPDFGAVLHALECAGPGDVLVIAAGGNAQSAMIGEILSGHCATAAVPVWSATAPSAMSRRSPAGPTFSVFSRWVTPRGPSGAVRGKVNVPVTVGGRLVTPGDLVIGDDDGLVALSPETVRSRIRDAEAKLALEAEWIAGLAGGRSVVEAFGLSPAKAG